MFRKLIDYFNKNQSKVFFPILFIGLVFRIFNIDNFAIGVDQVQILNSADKIIHGDLSLIGPKTGPADMFTGPLIYYISVPFLFVFGNEMTAAFVPLFISLITGLTLFFISKKYLTTQEALTIICIWAFSPFLVNFDRIFWNPDLSLLAASLLFIPLLGLRNDKETYLYFILGGFLSYQSHFSGLFLVFLSIMTLTMIKKSRRFIASIMFGFFVSILPTFIFDLRNNFLNLRGLLTFFSEKSSFSILKIINDFIHNAYVLIETLGKIYLFPNSTGLIVAVGAIIFIIFLFIFKKTRISKIFISWLVSTSIIFGFYSGEKPEYYFLFIVPLLIILTTKLLLKLPRYQIVIVLIIFCINSSFVNINRYRTFSGIKTGSIHKIKVFLKDKNVRKIIYDMPVGVEVGIKYSLTGLEDPEGNQTVHIAYPSDLDFEGIEYIADIAIWFDPTKQ